MFRLGLTLLLIVEKSTHFLSDFVCENELIRVILLTGWAAAVPSVAVAGQPWHWDRQTVAERAGCRLREPWSGDS